MNSKSSPEAPSAEERLRIQAEHVKQLYQNASLGMAATVINSAVLSYVQWDFVPHKATLIWLFCLLALTLLRSVYIYAYHRSPVPAAESGRWGRWFIAGMALSGAIWGSAAIFLFPPSSPAHQALLLFVLGGMVAGAAGTYSVIRMSFLAYSVPALAPLAVRLFSMGDKVHVAMGGMTVLFGVLLYGTAERVRAAANTSLRLGFENNHLIAYLASAKERTDNLNKELVSEVSERRRAQEELQKHREHLEDAVAERTAELLSANIRLRDEIAARKEAEELLRQSEEYFRSLIENALDIITVLDSKGNILFESPSMEKILGYTQEERIGNDVFAFLNPEDRLPAHQAFARLVQAPGAQESIEVRIRHKNGSWRLIESIGKSIGSDSRSLRVIVNSRDTTERKKLEENLRKSQKLESLGLLAGGIAHDFNNVITGIIANIDLAMLNTDRESESYSQLKNAETASVRAKDLTQHLLTFSRGGEPVTKSLLLGDLIRESAEFALRGSRSRCAFSIPDNLLPVEADEGQIRQVIHNIVMNADQAMPQGGVITVACENVTIGPRDGQVLLPGHYVKISVADQGMGIPREHLSKVFDPYFSTKQKGSGLGLAVSYSIVKKHHGDIAVESVMGVGTTLILHLPASRKGAEISPRRDGLVFGTGRVLVMDDEAIVRESAEAVLKMAGYDVETVKDGDEAIELYRKARETGNPFGVVIIDLTVPAGKGGKDTMQELLEIDPGVKALVSSGYSHDPIMAHYKDYGFRGVIAKPYRIREMSEIVRKVMTAEGENVRDSGL